MKAFFNNKQSDATKNKAIVSICTNLDAHQWQKRN